MSFYDLQNMGWTFPKAGILDGPVVDFVVVVVVMKWLVSNSGDDKTCLLLL